MTREIAYRNGQFVPNEELLIRPQDMGFVLGVTVAEQLRTFCGLLADVEMHFERLKSSLHIIGLSDVDVPSLISATKQLAANNHGLLDNEASDIGVTVFVTPGLYPTYHPRGETEPTIGIHSFELPFSMWAEKYDSGQDCEIVSVPQVSASNWPRELKCRSRMHYFLADREARTKNPKSRAILLDEAGFVNEASTANVVAYFKSEGLVSPPLDLILPGVTLRRTERIARSVDCPFVYRPLTVEELLGADEVLLTSTPFCVLPVSRIGTRGFSDRSCFRRIIEAWNADVGLNIEEQANRFRR